VRSVHTYNTNTSKLMHPGASTSPPLQAWSKPPSLPNFAIPFPAIPISSFPSPFFFQGQFLRAKAATAFSAS